MYIQIAYKYIFSNKYAFIQHAVVYRHVHMYCIVWGWCSDVGDGEYDAYENLDKVTKYRSSKYMHIWMYIRKYIGMYVLINVGHIHNGI